VTDPEKTSTPENDEELRLDQAETDPEQSGHRELVATSAPTAYGVPITGLSEPDED